jgi:hypothetical protein
VSTRDTPTRPVFTLGCAAGPRQVPFHVERHPVDDSSHRGTSASPEDQDQFRSASNDLEAVALRKGRSSSGCTRGLRRPQVVRPAPIASMVNNVVEGSEPSARVSGHPEQSACDLSSGSNSRPEPSRADGVMLSPQRNLHSDLLRRCRCGRAARRALGADPSGLADPAAEAAGAHRTSLAGAGLLELLAALGGPWPACSQGSCSPRLRPMCRFHVDVGAIGAGEDGSIRGGARIQSSCRAIGERAPDAQPDARGLGSIRERSRGQPMRPAGIVELELPAPPSLDPSPPPSRRSAGSNGSTHRHRVTPG